MALRLNGSTSGYVELNAPAVAGSQSLTIPYGILQVVSNTDTGTYHSNTNTLTDAYSSPSITTTGNNQVLVIFNFSYYNDSWQTKSIQGHTRIVRNNTTTVFEHTHYGYTDTIIAPGSHIFVDSPGAGTWTYKLQYRRVGTSGPFGIGASSGGITSDNTATLMEIAV